MKISFSATNPCHVYHVARELGELGELGQYYSGYPRWKLPAPNGMATRCHALRTCAVYGALKFLPERLRPKSRTLFRWQDDAFDRWVGRHLEPCDFIHGIPGQCRDTFRAAKLIGARTVLNHATGPVRDWVRILEPEYRRVGLALPQVTPYDAAYFQREDEEYALADFHCAASTIVRDQLAGRGVPAGSIWVVPYGAEEVWKRGFSCRRPRIAPLNFAERWGFSLPSFGGEGRGGEAAFAVGGSWGEESRKEGPFRVVFAGQLALRKGVRFLLRALEMAGRKDWKLDCYGAVLRETETDRRDYRGVIPVQYHGPVRQSHLAEAFRTSSVLVLPSLEEGFGLVVVQALACGLPCIVSDSVGAKDLIQHRVNGSICATGNAEALKTELEWWESHPGRATGDYGWAPCARELLRVSARAK